eukprot:COSAG02_NODE_7262_length_3092_cov_1.273973_3_plen_146_part_00
MRLHTGRTLLLHGHWHHCPFCMVVWWCTYVPVVKQMIRHVLAVSQKLGLVDKPSETVVAVPAAWRRARTKAVVVRGRISSARKMASLIGSSSCRWVRTVLQRIATCSIYSRFSCCHGERAGCDREDAQRRRHQHLRGRAGRACTR